jgi:hypothetical protein
MNFKETKFAYRHKPTGKWVALDFFIFNDPYLFLIDEFTPEITYKARNIIEEDLLRSTMNGEKYAALNFLEFEFVEIEVEYKIKPVERQTEQSYN